MGGLRFDDYESMGESKLVPLIVVLIYGKIGVHAFCMLPASNGEHEHMHARLFSTDSVGSRCKS